MGKDWEDLFMERMPIPCHRGTREQDMYDHIDVIDSKGNTYDVKGYKGNHFVWLEFMNVYGGKGWMKGKADYIAFWLHDSFYIVNRKKLLNWCKENLPNIPPQRDKSLFYTPYRRKGRKDILFKVKVEDITNLAIAII